MGLRMPWLQFFQIVVGIVGQHHFSGISMLHYVTMRSPTTPFKLVVWLVLLVELRVLLIELMFLLIILCCFLLEVLYVGTYWWSCWSFLMVLLIW